MNWLAEQAEIIRNTRPAYVVNFEDTKRRIEVCITAQSYWYKAVVIFFVWNEGEYITENPVVKVAYSLNDGLPGEMLSEIAIGKLESVDNWSTQPRIMSVIEEIESKLKVEIFQSGLLRRVLGYFLT